MSARITSAYTIEVGGPEGCLEVSTWNLGAAGLARGFAQCFYWYELVLEGPTAVLRDWSRDNPTAIADVLTDGYGHIKKVVPKRQTEKP